MEISRAEQSVIKYNLEQYRLDQARLEKQREQDYSKKIEQRRLEQEKQKGPSSHVIRKYRLGDRLPTLVNRMMMTGALSTAKAAKVLGVKPMSVYKLTSFADTSLSF